MASKNKTLFSHSLGCRSLESRYWQGSWLLETLKEKLSQASLLMLWLFDLYVCPSLISRLHPHIAFFSESLCILWGYSVTICYDLISILTLITFAKTLFPNKVTFWGSVCRHEFGGKHHSSHCRYQPIHFPNRNGMSPIILYIFMIIKYMQDLFFSFALKILFLIGG